MKGKIFIDTNILIYAHDLDAGSKNEISADLMLNLWENRMGIISTQVLQEFYVNVTRKILNPLSKSKARGIIESYLVWHVELNGIKTILFASEIEERHLLSFWDSLIIAAAYNAKADKILTEDLNHGQIIEGILIENPFKNGDKMLS
ncbi:MAG: PIN domain-containing protein [Proteobacteria bacterium]|nr:PIN domain-containing protein [Pseudomonadota bacterium]MBU4287417.1 PIN domain-containing protein [Pseudomonadota bacterium]MBU4414385.1 PIN domain-containing protein [Pseudomonadota bacterium]MCG2757863.1 PIN domain-containing protein [Desulfobacteraceae bacterium]